MSSPHKKYRASDFRFEATIGSGAFGQVRLAYHPIEDEWRAIKVTTKAELVAHDIVDLALSEVVLLRNVKHPFIVDLIATFHDEKRLYLVLEFLRGGDMRRRLSKMTRLPPADVQFYAAQLLCALEYLHDANVLYRNLRPETVVVDEFGYVKIVDMTLARLARTQVHTMCGDPEYVAPEVLLQRGYSFPVDVWALGILTFELLVGYPPFCGTHPFAIYQLILNDNPPTSTHLDDAGLVSRLLVKDPRSRLSIADAKSHAWFAAMNWSALLDRHLPAPSFVPDRHRSRIRDHFDDYTDETPARPVRQHQPDDVTRDKLLILTRFFEDNETPSDDQTSRHRVSSLSGFFSRSSRRSDNHT